MYCVRCGMKQPEGAVFCSNCGGTVFSDTVPAAVSTVSPERHVRDTAIPLRHSIPAEEPVRKETSARTDRSIPLMHSAASQVPAEKEPEKKAAPVSQRAIARPAAAHREGAEPRPFFYQPPEARTVSAETSPEGTPAAEAIRAPELTLTDALSSDLSGVMEEISPDIGTAAEVPVVPSEETVSAEAPDVTLPEETVKLSEETASAPDEETAVQEAASCTEETPSVSPDIPVHEPAEQEPAEIQSAPVQTDAEPEEDTVPEETVPLTSEEQAHASEESSEKSTEEIGTAAVTSADTPEIPPVTEKTAAKADTSEKGSLGKKGYIAAAAAVIILFAGLWYAFRIWPQKQFEKFYSAGSQALDQLDYEKAAENLALAYKIKQDDHTLNEMLYMAYQGVYDQKMQEGDLEAAIEAGSGMVGLVPENDEAIKASLGKLYISYVRTLLLDGRTEKASKAVTTASQYLTEEDLGSLNALQESFSKLSTFADKVAEMADGGQHRDICTMIDEIKPDIIACSDTSTGRQPVVRVKDRSHQYVVFYRHSSGQYYVFYGDLTDEGKRTGSGSIYYDGRSTSKDMLYYYTAGWENDKPNGEFSEHEFTGSRYGTETVYEGMLKDGFFDGRIAITWGSSGVYYGEYTSGKVTVLEIDEETGRYIIAYNEAHDDFLSFPNDPSSSRFGVDFY